MDTRAPALQIDQKELEAAVRRALRASVEVARWSAVPLSYDCTNPASSGVYRVAGVASDGKRSEPWSMVLKVLRSPAGMTMPNGAVVPRDIPDDPTLFGFWKREALVYGANLLEDLPGGLAAPRCYGVAGSPDGSVRLWLEEVEDIHGGSWTLQRYGLAARHLGRFNGAYLAGEPLPDEPWLRGGWLRSFLGLVGARMMELAGNPAAWEHPLVRGALGGAEAERLLRLWTERETLLAVLDSLPQTFCHRDAFRPNLFARRDAGGQERTVAIDWAFAGAGPVGEEIAPLVAMRPAGWAEQLDPWELEATVFDGYLQGLFEAGWRGDPRSVRFGYAASAALRYAVPTAAEMLGDAHARARHAAVKQRRGQSIERVMERQAALTRFLLDLADEARALTRSLPALASCKTRVARSRSATTQRPVRAIA